MKFTPTEWEIIDNRLQLVDAVVQCFTDYDPAHDPAPEYNEAELEAAIHELIEAGRDGIEDTPIRLAVLQDCCDGCTFFADIEDAVCGGEMSRGKMLAYFKAANSLDDKLNTYTNRD